MYINLIASRDSAKKKLWIALTAAVALRIGAASDARAEDSSGAPHADPPTFAPPAASSSGRWYGYQTLAIDGGAIFMATFGAYGTMQVASDFGSKSATSAGVGVIGLSLVSYVIGPPIVHWAHRRVAAGFESVALRLLAPLAGLGVGGLVAQFANGPKEAAALPLGAAFGLLAASALDATLLGWESVPDHSPPGAGFQPRIVLNSRVAFVGFGGAF